MTVLNQIRLILILLLGASFGSFLSLAVTRTNARTGICFPASHCEWCHHFLAPLDLIPILSWLFLRGRCRYCQHPISKLSWLAECSLGFCFLLIALRYPIGSWHIYPYCQATLLTVLALQDWTTRSFSSWCLALLALSSAIVTQRWLALGLFILFWLLLDKCAGRLRLIGEGDLLFFGYVWLSSSFYQTALVIFIASGFLLVLGFIYHPKSRYLPFIPALAMACEVVLQL
ncbi:prepilin peptidase [Levilactobacillus bambusae]|uniref:Prepilin peptidase A24 N-terminal domain-containing protein n=1 Tax=Levilactobacillus bambusae TaxID=2024736 RepID=A0A2V1MYD4_9LACO|nr:A24 family peptidase [Levilactobacillus bambusae]PWF99986.1 hypothetical protein DCM90_03300 [Levilactobacillus bambusae]